MRAKLTGLNTRMLTIQQKISAVGPKNSSNVWCAITQYFRVDLGLFVVLILPLLLLTLNTQWIFGNTGGDPWAYLGYFLNLTDHLQDFPYAYSGSRLPWLLPGYIAYHTFLPPVANYVLHLGFYYLAIISLYLTLKYTINRRVALLTSLLMGVYPHFLLNIGSDYISGAGISYFLLTILLLTCAAKFSWWRIAIFSSGLAFAALIHTNIFLLIFFPIIVLYYLLVNHDFRKNSLLVSSVFFVLGVFGLTGFFEGITFHINGVFLATLSSIYVGSHLFEDNPFGPSSYGYFIGATWLVLPMTMFLGSLLFLWRNRTALTLNRLTFSLLFPLLYVLITFIMLFLDLMGQPVLNYQFYASYLVPGMFLAFGALLPPLLARLTKPQFAAIVCIAILFLLLPYFPTFNSIITVLNTAVPHIGQYLAVSMLIFVLLGLIVLLTVPSSLKSLTLVLLLASMAYSTMTLSGHYRSWQVSTPWYPWEKYSAVIKGMQTVRAFDHPRGSTYFWYGGDGPEFNDIYRGVAMTHFWGRKQLSLITDKFPSLEPLIHKSGTHGHQPTNGMKIVILSRDQDALAKANLALSRIGLSAQFLLEKTIEVENISFREIFVEAVSRDDQSGLELIYEATSFASDWQVLNDAEFVTNEQGTSIKITTNPSDRRRKLISAPIPVKRDALYSVEFEFKLETGTAGFQILNEKRDTAILRFCWREPTALSDRAFIFDSADSTEIYISFLECDQQPEFSVFEVSALKVWAAHQTTVDIITSEATLDKDE